MLGTYYYHEIIRKTIVSFGTLFNSIEIQHKDADGDTYSEMRVPLSYGPSQKFLARLEQQGDLQGALGAMRTYIHLAPPDDPFRRKAMSATWEWEEMIDRKRQGKDPKLPTDNATALGE